MDCVLYSTIIFIGGNVPDDCLNTVVSVAVISESGFEISRLRLKSPVFILTFAGMEKGKKGRKRTPLFNLKLLTSLNISSSLTVSIFL